MSKLEPGDRVKVVGVPPPLRRFSGRLGTVKWGAGQANTVTVAVRLDDDPYTIAFYPSELEKV